MTRSAVNTPELGSPDAESAEAMRSNHQNQLVNDTMKELNKTIEKYLAK